MPAKIVLSKTPWYTMDTTEVSPPFEKGKPFSLRYSVKNIGDTGTVFGYIIDNDTGNIIPTGKWNTKLGANHGASIITPFTKGLNSDLHATLVLGHYENTTEITDVTYDFDITTTGPTIKGIADITHIKTYPSSFTPGKKITIGVGLMNIGYEPDTLWYHIKNKDTDETIAEGTKFLTTGSQTEIGNDVILTQTTDFHGIVEAGHNNVTDDIEEFTIPVKPIEAKIPILPILVAGGITAAVILFYKMVVRK